MSPPYAPCSQSGERAEAHALGLVLMGEHLTKRGTFQSDKYDWCPEGFFTLKLTDPIAQEAALLYAARTDDQELAEDIREAVRRIRGPVHSASLMAYIGATAASYGFTHQDLVGRSRRKRVSHARHVAMYLCRMQTRASFAEIGGAFQRHHSNVIYAVKVVAEKIRQRPTLAGEINAVAAHLILPGPR